MHGAHRRAGNNRALRVFHHAADAAGGHALRVDRARRREQTQKSQ